MINAILGGYVTAVNRNFHSIVSATCLEVVQEKPLGFGGLYYLYLLRKPGLPCDDSPVPLPRAWGDRA